MLSLDDAGLTPLRPPEPVVEAEAALFETLWRAEGPPPWPTAPSRLRKGHGARTMAIVRHFAVNPVRSAPDPVRSEPLEPQRRRKPGANPHLRLDLGLFRAELWEDNRIGHAPP